ncbi:MAG: hypothetical protein Q9222_007608 [Ikaeria aurantiellina]
MSPLLPQQSLRASSSSTPTHDVAMGARRNDSTDFSVQPSSGSASSSSSHSRPQHPLSAASTSDPGRKNTTQAESLSDGFTQASSSPAEQQRSRRRLRNSSLGISSSKNSCNSLPLPYRSRHPARSKGNTEPAEDGARLRHKSHAKRETREKRDGPECLWSAGLHPPVTQESLSELDLQRIINDSRLRHDLNFEHEIIFRPNNYGARGRQKKCDELQYFDALLIELSHYMDRRTRHLPSLSRLSVDSGPNTPYASIQPRPPQRVPLLLGTICDVVKTLVPAAKWQAVDEQFDVGLRMQELEHGICDIAGLIDWLGKLMLCSCSPMRDPMVTAVVEKTQQAVVAENAASLVNAIRDLFAVLETMNENIEYEQNQILDRVAAGWSIIQDRRWFEAAYESPEREDPFLMFKEQVLSRIVTPLANFPRTLASDSERLSVLQYDFRLCHYHLACGHTFTHTLHRLGWTGSPPTAAYTQCMQHIGAIIGTQGTKFSFEAHPNVVLEIVRGAHELCKIPGLPSPKTLATTQLYFREALEHSTAFYSEIEGDLWDELAKLVHAEADAIFNLTPLEILNRYDPGPNHRPADISLEGIAKRAAHIIVLHWRVWAPILYNQPDHQRASTRTSPRSTTENETSSRAPRPRGIVSTKASKPEIVTDDGVQHLSKTASLSEGSNASTPASENSSTLEREPSVEEASEGRSRRPSV